MNCKFSFLIKLCLLFLLSALFKLSYARILNVPDDFQTIQAGIETAEDGDTVLVARGVYNESLEAINKNITVTGVSRAQFATIDPERAGYGILIEGCSGAGIVLSCLKIRNAGREEESEGGGLLARNSIVRLRNIEIENCYSFNRNWIIDEGAGINAIECQLFFDNVTIRGCLAEAAGAMALFRSTLVANDFFVDNCRGSRISGVLILDSEITLNRAVIYAPPDRTEDPDQFNDIGGCLSLDNSIAHIDSALFRGGVSMMGGGLMGYQSQIEMTNSIATENHSMEMGGGIALWECQYLLDRCTIINNTSGSRAAGMISVDSSNSILINCIIRGNVADETPQFRSECWPGWNVAVTVSYCDIEGGQNDPNLGDTINWADGNFDVDPQFVDPANSDYHLREDSPCIDAGNPESPLDPDGTRADVGAFYYYHENLVQFNKIAPSELSFSAYPNPFNSTTTINLSTDLVSQPVRLTIHDLSGRLVSDLTNSAFRNPHSAIGKVVWDARGLPDGIYLIRLELKNKSETMKTILIK